MIQGERTLAGRYEIGRRIGRGGMAEVYLGLDERLGRRVAVKLLNTQLSGEPDFRFRFRAEAQAAARMTHPTIVRVFDAGEDTFVRADGHELIVPYIVMEYVEGDQLRDLMLDAPLANDKIASYMSGILTALEYSHRAGVVHRDIKPGNIKVTPDGTVKVMDFGIARAISDTAGTIAQTTAILGTASYFSPEQARGENVDGRSDLYSAGIVLYEMLTGQVPFQGDSAVAVAYQHVTERPVPPSELNPNVSPAMDAVVLRALAKSPDDRFQSASEFRRDLELAVQGIMPAFGVEADETEDTQLFGPAPTAVAQTESAFAALSENDERAPTVQRRPPAMWIWGAAALILAIVAAVIFWVATLPRESQLPQAGVEIPDVVGATWEEADAELTELQLVPSRETATSDEVPAGIVMSLSPDVGLTVPVGQVVTVTVSAGPSSVELPNINGMTVEQATSVLEGEGLALGTVTTENSPSAPQGTIIRSEPVAGSQVGPDSTVDVVVSSGLVELPDLVGTGLEEATSTLQSLGLRGIVESDPNCPAEEGDPIVSMSLAAGPVEQHSDVTITYCTGSAENPAPTPTPTDSPAP
ncbi:Stk1 family PASTA domain-containing Ser/Thr kinase [Pseudoclavibacter endophyticus]|uniref:Stk1 family PASTA domain-containing Ser/Thr kinase n=1 Tax=Pseudoclavibacter endophyticus TaxID=1778590 RepID=UPI001CE490AA|nr:Stk1 family PASTA domain-containing Ser/Thr kinase [Pseudoclavibacter endophyticus]